MTDSECTFCGDKLRKIDPIDTNTESVDCPTCGHYRIFSPDWEFTKIPGRHLISGYIREQNELHDKEPSFNTRGECENAKELTPTRIPDKAAKLLNAVQRRTSFFGNKVELTQQDYPLGYCRHPEEFTALLHYCRARGWLTCPSNARFIHNAGIKVDLSADGFEELETRARTNIESEKAFVAMRFNDEMSTIYDDAIKPAIEECGYRPVRIDQEEFNGDIIDQMLAEIRESRFIVADFTEHRHGVYFEAGFALGLSLPVIWTCRKDHIDDAHFDTNHFKHIEWTTAEELRERLVNRIRATTGLGPLKSKR